MHPPASGKTGANLNGRMCVCIVNPLLGQPASGHTVRAISMRL
ncbi:hypothetical protein AB434_3167 [Heyndrickxia coagulans]|uniref:Uncharacterized protein n=1 Tax=Heyndrickxia coagulans TaxID=1398 RepID=A0AAN0WCE6_HEYCO|nr:hypothetical protein SB48_HM08orf03358 [Heyndrickxia coagulans]AKN55572.1 hypothetical protein AB434_3167 [Heyndrickxia coagulans]